MSESLSMDKLIGLNDRTLRSYEEHVGEYIDGTPFEIPQKVQLWIDRSLEGLPKNARILEVGSGSGRDATYITSLGFDVECSDATRGFVDILQQKGFSAYELNILTDCMPGSFDFVFANAVLLHFDKDHSTEILKKIYHSLNPNGRFAFSLKKGKGEVWSYEKINAPRYFCYWQKSEIETAMKAAGFLSWQVDEDSAVGAAWLHVIATKDV